MLCEKRRIRSKRDIHDLEFKITFIKSDPTHQEDRNETTNHVERKKIPVEHHI